jgi:hypothetical protein
VYQVRPDGLPTCSVAIYVDGAVVSAPTYAHCREALGVISKIFMRLALREKRSKRGPPTRRCQFLGIEVDTSGGSVTVRVPPAKLALIRSTISKVVGKVGAGSSVHRRQLASLVGLLSFFSKAVPASRAYLWRLSVAPCLHDGVEVARDYDVDVTLSMQEAKGDLLWWHTALLLGRFLGGAANGTKPPTARQSRPARQIQRKKSPNIKFNLSSGRPLFDDLVQCAPHDRGEHALPMRRKPIFSAEDGVLSAWSLDIFYGVFTRRDWRFPGGPAIKIRGGALTHGRRLLGSKLVSNFHAGHPRRLAGPCFYSPIPNQRSGWLG